MSDNERHEEDREFIQLLRSADDTELRMLLKFQAAELWRRVAIKREMERRETR